MANYLHRTSKEYRVSMDGTELPGFPANWISNPDLSAVAGLQSKFWIITGDIVTAMTAQQQADLVAAELAALLTSQRANAVDALDTIRDQALMLIRALALITRDEVNVVRSWLASFKTQVAAATTLADLKTRVATLPATPDRTIQQLRTAITTAVDAGDADN